MPEVSPPRVLLLGMALVALGAMGFHEIPGMIAEDAEGSKEVNAVYCSVITLTTVGFGDICPGEIDGIGRAFIVLLSFSGLGLFCGPIMDLAASWKDTLADKMGLLLFCVLTCIFVFSYMLEEMSESEAAYFSIITGTTIGYGDISPKSDTGKLAVAVYAVLAVNVVASLLEPAKDFLLEFCLVSSLKDNLEDRTAKQSTSTEKNDGKVLAHNGDASTDENATENSSATKSKKKKKKKKKGGNNNNNESTAAKKHQ